MRDFLRKAIVSHLLTVALGANFLIPVHAQQTDASQMGRFLGAKATTHPDWFKESFLEFEEDIAEAAAADKRLIVYFYQDGCPYCNKLVEENFRHPDISAKIQSHFDLVAINMWGDREVVEVGGKRFTEKTLAAALDVNFTPTLLFFGENRQVALRLDGYYPQVEFDRALDYVSQKMEAHKSFARYLAQFKSRLANQSLESAAWVQTGTVDATIEQGPMIVLFEEPDCENCRLLHTRTFQRPEAKPLLAQFKIIQLNRWSDQPVILPGGETSTASAWADSLKLGFSPAIAVYNEDAEKVIVAGAMFKSFHIMGILDYVASGAYRRHPSFQRYLSERAEHIRSTGRDVNIWEY